jgi:hypothetical protein
MAFTVSDFNDFKQLLLDHPAWQVEVRRLLLSQDFEALPGIVRRLAEAQERLVEGQNSADQRLARLEKVVNELAQAQERFVERQDSTDQRLARLEKVVAELAEALRQLTLRVDAMAVTLAKVNGRTLEGEYREKAPAYFGPWIRRTTVVARTALEEQLEERLSDDELHDALLIDLVVRGRLRRGPQSAEVYLAVEVSSVVDREDVSRAVRHAELMRHAGISALPVVAGESATQGARDAAAGTGVLMLQDGTGLFWDEAIARWPIG